MADDIPNGICILLSSLRRAGLAPPALIVLASSEDGRRLMASCPRSAYDGPATFPELVETPDGCLWRQIRVCGVWVRWPMNHLAERSLGEKGR